MLPPCRDAPIPVPPGTSQRGLTDPRTPQTPVPPGSPHLHAQTPGSPSQSTHPGMSPPSHTAVTALCMGCSTPTVTPANEEEEEEAAGEAGVPSKVHSMPVAVGRSPGGGCSPRSAPWPAAKKPRDILKPCSRLLPGALPAPGLERGRGWGDATPPIAACAPAGRPRTAPGAQGEPGTGLLPGTRREPAAVTRGHTPLTPLSPSQPGVTPPIAQE